MSQGSAPTSPSSGGSGKTVPKERGCFQCSRRRIICDRTEPTCKKCIKKGIGCSGLGRIRFAEGVARRGQLKDLKVPVSDSDPAKAALPVKVDYEQVRWKNEQKKTAVKRKRKRGIFEIASPVDFQSIQSPQDRGAFASPITFGDFSNHEDDDDITEIVRTDNHILTIHSTTSSIPLWLTPLTSEARMLFSYCKILISPRRPRLPIPVSDAVAPAMVVLDTVPNGYREFLLPMAAEDEVLRRAIGVVAAQHLSREKPELIHAAEAGRSAIISRLRKESLHNAADQVFNSYTWATLIVLLVGETVTGSADYSFLMHMLLCLSMNITANHARTDVTDFLQAQTNMFRFLGVPQLAEDKGVLAIMESYQSMIGWLSPACDQFTTDSEEGRTMQMIRQCFASASAIYIHRATTELPDDLVPPSYIEDDSQQPVIQDLIARISRIPPTSPGAHALVWACFVAGAETADPEQRQFFIDYMLAIYERTKFRNIPLGVQGLKRIWSRKGNRRWTQCLSELSNVLVM